MKVGVGIALELEMISPIVVLIWNTLDSWSQIDPDPSFSCGPFEGLALLVAFVRSTRRRLINNEPCH